MFRKKSPTKRIVLSFFGGKSAGKVLKSAEKDIVSTADESYFIDNQLAVKTLQCCLFKFTKFIRISQKQKPITLLGIIGLFQTLILTESYSSKINNNEGI